MIRIEDYIQLPLSKRREHLALKEVCIERGGPDYMISLYVRGLLAQMFDTSMPSGFNIQACHACNNSRCSNPNHSYWGTAKENRADGKANGQKSAWEYTVAKHGFEEMRRIQAKARLGKKKCALVA